MERSSKEIQKDVDSQISIVENRAEELKADKVKLNEFHEEFHKAIIREKKEADEKAAKEAVKAKEESRKRAEQNLKDRAKKKLEDRAKKKSSTEEEK